MTSVPKRKQFEEKTSVPKRKTVLKDLKITFQKSNFRRKKFCK